MAKSFALKVVDSGKTGVAKKQGASRYMTSWDALKALTITKDPNRSLKVDLSTPRALLFAIRVARMECMDMGVNPDLQNIMAGGNAATIRCGVENCIDLVGVWGGRRIPFPLEDAQVEVKKLLAAMFSNPEKISPKLSKPAQPYELAFVGKTKLLQSASQAEPAKR